MFKFMEGWFIEPSAISLDEFVRATFITRGRSPGSHGGDYWTHLKSWWLRRNDADVLFTAYEHMKKDSTGTIHKVAKFMDIALDDELLAIAEKHASLPFMQKHKDRFDDKLMRERSIAVTGLPADSESSKVRTGQVGESRKQLGADVAEGLVRLAQVLSQKIDDGLALLAPLDDLADRNAEPLLIAVACGRRRRPADINGMGGTTGKRDQPAVTEDRMDHRDVVEMAGADPAVV